MRLTAIRKLRNNVLTLRAMAVMGIIGYIRYGFSLLLALPAIARSGHLRELDRRMGRATRSFRYRGARFVFDCPVCDRTVSEDSYAFGLAREIYIRDCYFRWMPPEIYQRARVVMDIGANRGAFSSLMTTRADFILAVDCGAQYRPVIEHNLRANHCRAYAIETVFVGAGGVVDAQTGRVGIDELMRRHSLARVDLLKLDIEGSEFALFAQGEWLQRIDALCMEVHPAHGDPSLITCCLSGQGFAVVMAEADLQRTGDPKAAAFIYAWRR